MAILLGGGEVRRMDESMSRVIRGSVAIVIEVIFASNATYNELPAQRLLLDSHPPFAETNKRRV